MSTAVYTTKEQFNMAEMVENMCDEISTPYITLPTRSYAKLCAAIHFLGGEAIDVVGNDPYWPGFAPEPEVDAPAVEKPAAKAMQLIAWGDNGLKAVDKQCYDLVLRMTKTQPGQDTDYVRVSLGAISTRLGVSPKSNTASKALWGLVDLGLLEAVRRPDRVTGNTHIYARAGKMPAWGEVYGENAARAKDAKRKRICESCGSTKLRLQHVCTDCGALQTEAPHYEELVENMADLENRSRSDQVPDRENTDHVYREDLISDCEDQGGPAAESAVGVLLEETRPTPPKIYYIGPRRMYDRNQGLQGNQVPRYGGVGCHAGTARRSLAPDTDEDPDGIPV